LDKMVNDVLITKENDHKYKMYYTYKYRSSRFYSNYVTNIICENDDHRLKIYYDFEKDHPEITMDYKILTYFCTEILPVSSLDEFIDIVNILKLNIVTIGIDRKYNNNKEITSRIAEKLRYDDVFYNELITSPHINDVNRSSLVYILRRLMKETGYGCDLKEYAESIKKADEDVIFDENVYKILTTLFTYINFKILDDNMDKEFESGNELDDIYYHKYDTNDCEIDYINKYTRFVNNNLLISNENKPVDFNFMRQEYYTYDISSVNDYVGKVDHLFITDRVDQNLKSLKSRLMDNFVHTKKVLFFLVKMWMIYA